MEVELNYASVNFKPKDIKAHEKPSDLEIIYDEVKTEQQQAQDASSLIPENGKKAPACAHIVAATFGVICVILGSVLIGLYMHLSTMLSEQVRDEIELTAKMQQLRTEKVDLERRVEELTRAKDALNWTFGVIMEYETFPVNTHCPQKVCKPCLDSWVLFQSHCYRFTDFDYSSQWNNWDESRKKCREVNADLVVIESQEEQEFINNHTKTYNKETNGYWIGSNTDVTNNWMWVDGSNLTVSYWRKTQPSNSRPCALLVPGGDPLANWVKASCWMYNRWICETKALVTDSAALSNLI